MVEGQTRYPEFERLLEKEDSSVYHEEYDYYPELSFGVLVAIFGAFPFLLLEHTFGIIQSVGLFFTLIGIIMSIRGFVLNRMGRREYSFRDLSRNTLSETIMYLDGRLTRPEELELSGSHHVDVAFLGYAFDTMISSTMKEGFSRFVKSTAGQITWPSGFIGALDKERLRMRRRVSLFSVSMLVFIPILTLVAYYLYTSGNLYLIFLSAVSLLCIPSSIGYIGRALSSNSHLLISNWLPKVKQSDTVQLEDSLGEIFILLQSEYQYPLRFYLAREYPLLKYTGRTTTSHSLIRLKEAVLYPRI